VPGEPQGFGDGEALLELLSVADGWDCVEVDSTHAAQLSKEFDRRWGLARTVTDVVHELHTTPQVSTHPLVRRLSALEARELDLACPELLPDRDTVAGAAEDGRVLAAVDGNVIVGHGSSLAASRSLADVGVHVAERFRQQGIATAAAALACKAVQDAGLTPVWGAGSDNGASLRVAEKLGFHEVARLVFLVRAT
jgi:RimJ/RimL family protein N-acetyltransferase